MASTGASLAVDERLRRERQCTVPTALGLYFTWSFYQYVVCETQPLVTKFIKLKVLLFSAKPETLHSPAVCCQLLLIPSYVSANPIADVTAPKYAGSRWVKDV